MLNAAAHMPQILARTRTQPPFLMLDFDGTISPIVQNPGEATMLENTRAALIACAKRYRVAIISGRTLTDIMQRVALPCVWYAGSHGLEWHTGAETAGIPVPHEAAQSLHRAREALIAASAEFPGTIREDKGLCFAVNYRALDPDAASRFSAAAQHLLAPLIQSESLRVIDSMRTFEVTPLSHWTKGECARMFYERACAEASAELTPIFIGDSVTDEDAFLEFEDGITIRVYRDETSAAQYYFDSRMGVDRFLLSLANA